MNTRYALLSALLVLAIPGSVVAYLPRNFRTLQQHAMLASGSGQFTLEELREVKNKVKKPLVVIDLRKESHYVHQPVSKQVCKRDTNKKQVCQLLTTKKTQKVAEPTAVASLGIQYLSLPIPDGNMPTSQQVDQLLAFLRKLKPDTWLHFHCLAGQGRTSSLLTFYDIYLHAHTTPLDTILKRQSQWGFSIKNHASRVKVFKDFYAFCLARKKNAKMTESWTSWLKRKR